MPPQDPPRQDMTDEPDHVAIPTYGHKPKVIGGEIVFKIEGDQLTWVDGVNSDSLALHQIESVRLSFRPANLTLHRYRCDIRQRLGRRIWFSNISLRGLADLNADDPAYRSFVSELCRRIAERSPKAVFLGGEPMWRYAPGLMFTISLAIAVLFLGFEAVRSANWGLLAIVAFIGGYVAWQMGLWIVKNRPAPFDPRAIRSDLLPPDNSR